MTFGTGTTLITAQGLARAKQRLGLTSYDPTFILRRWKAAARIFSTPSERMVYAKRNPNFVLLRRIAEAELILRGWTYRQVTGAYGIPPGGIKRDLENLGQFARGEIGIPERPFVDPIKLEYVRKELRIGKEFDARDCLRGFRAVTRTLRSGWHIQTRGRGGATTRVLRPGSSERAAQSALQVYVQRNPEQVLRRDYAIAELICREGKSQQQVAEMAGISRNAVESAMERLFKGVRARGRIISAK